MRSLLAAAILLAGAQVSAHVTPNVQLVKRGDFIKSNLPLAATFAERRLMIGGPDMAAIRKATGWAPSEEDAKVYVGRDAHNRLVGTAAFVWMPSEHGPVGIGVVFDPSGKIVRAAVTDVGTEPLAWVKPLLDHDGLAMFDGLALEAVPDQAKISPSVTGRMNRYYAEVIAAGIARAQALVKVSLKTEAS
jgi:hypothetical protein